MSGKIVSADFLIPSAVVTSVIEIYNRKDYPLVIKICDSVLNDVHNYYLAQERELRYWLCLALSRQKDERFFEVVQPMDYIDKNFLKGFYFRITMDYQKAENCFRKVLKDIPGHKRARRELVTTLMANNKYNKALEMAQQNYEDDPDNSYQIHGYFRCLVRKEEINREDIKVLNHLMDAMKDNLSDKHEELYVAMNIEYQHRIARTDAPTMYKIINEANESFPNSINVKRAAQPFYHKQGIINNIELLPED